MRAAVLIAANKPLDILKLDKKLNLDGLIGRTYKFEAINDGFKQMIVGTVARGVVVFD